MSNYAPAPIPPCVCLSLRFALGDARRPLQETAALVEDIVHTQLITMVTVLSCTNMMREDGCGRVY